MAEKKRLTVSTPELKEERVDDELPRKYEDIAWKEWLKVDFARYWFVVIAFGVDVLFGLDAMSLFSGEGQLGFILFLVITIPLEVLIYLHLWGKKGILMPRH